MRRGSRPPPREARSPRSATRPARRGSHDPADRRVHAELDRRRRDGDAHAARAAPALRARRRDRRHPAAAHRGDAGRNAVARHPLASRGREHGAAPRLARIRVATPRGARRSLDPPDQRLRVRARGTSGRGPLARGLRPQRQGMAPDHAPPPAGAGRQASARPAARLLPEPRVRRRMRAGVPGDGTGDDGTRRGRRRSRMGGTRPRAGRSARRPQLERPLRRSQALARAALCRAGIADRARARAPGRRALRTGRARARRAHRGGGGASASAVPRRRAAVARPDESVRAAGALPREHRQRAAACRRRLRRSGRRAVRADRPGVMLFHAVDCRPCAQRECPLRHHACMEHLAVDDVFAAVALAVGRATAADGGAKSAAPSVAPVAFAARGRA
jgi:hypothetical protein